LIESPFLRYQRNQGIRQELLRLKHLTRQFWTKRYRNSRQAGGAR